MKSVRKIISRDLGIILQDIGTGTRIGKTFDFLSQSQNWNSERMQAYQLKKLKKILSHAYDHVPYYSKLFNEIGIEPDDIRSLEDIKHIPVLTKKIARKYNFELVSNTMNPKKTKKGKTGGTTGSPLITYTDTQDRSFTWASYYRWYTWVGIRREDPVVTLWGAKTVLGKNYIGGIRDKFVSFLHNNIVIDSFTMDDQRMPKIYDAILRFEPVLLKGYLSAMLNLAAYIKKHGLDTPSSLKAVSSTTETLLPLYRKELSDVFRVPVFDQYGCGEVSAISYECSAHCGLHVNQEHVIIEVLDDQGNEIFGSPGRIIVTGLDNLAMPFIRYENGDLATLVKDQCPCGIKSSLMRSIDGRMADTIILSNGAKVHGVFFTDIFFEIGITVKEVSRFQAHQKHPGEVSLTLETAMSLDKNKVAALYKQLNRFFHTVSIYQTPLIPPGDNGKFKYIISEVL